MSAAADVIDRMRDKLLKLREAIDKELEALAPEGQATLPGVEKPKKERKSPVSEAEKDLMELIRAEALLRLPDTPYKCPYPKGDVIALHRLMASGVSVSKLHSLVRWSWGHKFWAGKVLSAVDLQRSLPRLLADFTIEGKKAIAEDSQGFLGQGVPAEVLRDGTKW